jgi:hypothetical protein
MKFILIIGCVLLAACHPDKSKKISIDELKTTTTDPSELFFKNVRQSDYNVEELPDAKMNIYRHKGFTDSSFFSVKIAYNWQQDAAYTMFALNQDIETFTLIINYPAGSENIEFENGPVLEQIKLNTHIYNALLQNATFQIQTNDSLIPILTNQDEREAFRISMFDFYRLVEIR